MQAQDFKELKDRVQRTCYIRHTAARRFARQQRISQWTVAWISVALIVLSLWPALGLPLRFSPQLINAVEIVFASLILTYSLLLNLDNYAIRSERLHSCGIELGRLTRKVEAHQGSTNADEYKSLADEYYGILSRYENHEHVDFLRSQADHPELYERDFKSGPGDEKQDRQIKYRWYWTWSWIAYWAGFVHYFVISVVVLVFILLMVFPPRTSTPGTRSSTMRAHPDNVTFMGISYFAVRVMTSCRNRRPRSWTPLPSRTNRASEMHFTASMGLS